MTGLTGDLNDLGDFGVGPPPLAGIGAGQLKAASKQPQGSLKAASRQPQGSLKASRQGPKRIDTNTLDVP